MLDKLLNIPLSYVDLRVLYLKGNDIQESKKNRPTVTSDMILTFLKDNGYGLRSKRVFNPNSLKMVKYYLLVKLDN